MIWRLGHVVLTVDDLAAARAFYVDLLGFDVYREDDASLHLRAAHEFDTWSLALVAGDGPGVAQIGFRTSTAEHLDVLEELHRARGLPTLRVPAGTEPSQGEALRTRTPSGHPVEFYHRFDEIELGDGDGVRLPMRRTNTRHGIPPARLDHVNLRVPSTPEALSYWDGDLGFRASEMWLHPDGTPRTAWVRRAAGTHDVALGENPVPGIHHVAYTLPDETSLVRASDLLGDAGLEHLREFGPSRHGATNALCMYVRDPAGNRVELYVGDYHRDLDRPPVKWSATEYARHGHSWWGEKAPASFAEATPVRTQDWPGEDPAPAAAAGDGAAR